MTGFGPPISFSLSAAAASAASCTAPPLRICSAYSTASVTSATTASGDTGTAPSALAVTCARPTAA